MMWELFLTLVQSAALQGQPISPLLANIYLHHVLDEWFEEVVKPRLKGEAREMRFADDAILCFERKEDAEKVLRVLPKRFAKYGLTLHPEKTRLIEFGRFAAGNAKRRGEKPATFDFLGFTHIGARSRKGKFTVHVKTIAKRFRRGLKAVADWCREHRHDPVSTLPRPKLETVQPKKAYSSLRTPLLGGGASCARAFLTTASGPE